MKRSAVHVCARCACALLVLAAAGCQRELPVAAPQSESPLQLEAAEGPAQTEQVSLNTPIPGDTISTKLEVASVPMFSPASRTISVEVRVHNNGQGPLVSRGAAMVRLGAMLVGPNGPDTPPGRRDFVRADLPVVMPGESATVRLTVPVDELAGLPLRLDLVQEGVNWFSTYGQLPLELGVFLPCDESGERFCTGDGTAVRNGSP